ncbi:MAG TPA: flagellin [Clostridia bacterium]|nr:flagellin [Clostridia bacterium]
MRINHNIAALNTYSRLTNASNMQSKSLEKLSSGLRINKAGDDAAGLAISEKMRGQISGLNQASRNAQDGISMVQTAEGALNETHSILQRMRELAVQSSNDTNTAEDRTSIQEEMNQLTSEITRIGNTTEFNTKSVINGDMSGTTGATGGSMTVQFTAAPADGDSFSLTIGEDTYAVTVADSAAADAIDTSAKTITINIDDTGAETLDADTLASQLEVVLTGSADANLANFTFTDSSAGGIEIEATAAGDFAGDDDIRGIIGVSYTGKATEVDATDGTGATDVAKLQIGANNGQTMEMSINDMRALELAVSSTTSGTSFTSTSLTDDSGTTEYALDLSTADKATAAIAVIDTAISSVSSERSALGSIQNRLEHTINNLGTASENLTAAESRVRDVDMAKEMMEFTKNNILSQAATSMLAQANQQPQSVLQLLR